jgi:hypothetical protein
VRNKGRLGLQLQSQADSLPPNPQTPTPKPQTQGSNYGVEVAVARGGEVVARFAVRTPPPPAPWVIVSAQPYTLVCCLGPNPNFEILNPTRYTLHPKS